MIPIIPLIAAAGPLVVSLFGKKDQPAPVQVAPAPPPAADYTIPIIGGAAILGAALVLSRR